MILTSLCFALAAPPIGMASAHWQLQADLAAYDTVQVYGTNTPETASGFKFTIVTQENGNLPAMLGDTGTSYGASSFPTTIYKKLPSGLYALFCAWSFRYTDGDSLLLPAGEYLYKSAANSPLYSGAILMTGTWRTPAQQNLHFEAVSSENTFTNIALLPSGTAIGLRIPVKNRADGRKPVVNQLTTIMTSNPDMFVYKRETRSLFSVYTAWRISSDYSPRGVKLEPGEYFVDVRNTPHGPQYYEHARLLIGHYE